MEGVEWRFLSDEDTKAFRKERKSPGFYRPGLESIGVFQVSKDSSVKDRDGDLHILKPGERIKILDSHDRDRYQDQDWLLFAQEVHVSYGQGVESLRAGTCLAALFDLEKT